LQLKAGAGVSSINLGIVIGAGDSSLNGDAVRAKATALLVGRREPIWKDRAL
jgi:hypothetical protein